MPALPFTLAHRGASAQRCPDAHSHKLFSETARARLTLEKPTHISLRIGGKVLLLLYCRYKKEKHQSMYAESKIMHVRRKQKKKNRKLKWHWVSEKKGRKTERACTTDKLETYTMKEFGAFVVVFILFLRE